jgi:hypothetical protein
MLDAGRVRVSSSSGISAIVTTKDGSAVADNNQPNVFMVDVECGNTVVSTQSGRVELRAGNSVKQIAAGGQDTAGQATPGTRCTRFQQPEMRGLSGGAPARSGRRNRGGHYRGLAGRRIQLRRQPHRHQPLALTPQVARLRAPVVLN